VVHRDPVERHNLEVGLCSICDHASHKVSVKGVAYWCCCRVSSETVFRRYPTLPVEKCVGFEIKTPKTTPPTARQERGPSGTRDAASESKGFAR